MQITELQLIKFGKFLDYNIELSDGLNVIFGENEAGKSTIFLFIKTMLYGLKPKRGRAGELKDRARIIPWNGDRAAGRIKLRSNGRNIEVYREFRKRASGDILRVTDSDTGEDIKLTGEVGESLFGMSESMFERTLWIKQDDVCIRGGDDEITARLMNLLNTGSASDVSVSEALSLLEKRELSLKARTKRNTMGEIDTLLCERDGLSAQLTKISRESEERQRKAEKLRELERVIKNADIESEKLNSARSAELAREKIKRVRQLDNCLKREMQLANTRMFQVFKHNIKDDTAERLKADRAAVDDMEVRAYDISGKLDEERSALDRRSSARKVKRILFMLPSILSVIACAVFFALGYIVFGAACAAASVVFGAVYAVIIKRYDVEIKDIEARTTELETQLSRIRSDIKSAEARVGDTLSIFECENITEFNEKYGIYCEDKAKIKVCRDIYNETLGGDDYAHLKAEADRLSRDLPPDAEYNNIDVNTESRLKALADKKDNALKQAAELRQSIADAEGLRTAADVRAEIDEIDRTLSEKRRELSAVQLAAECMSEAYTKLKSDYTPRLNAKTQEVLGMMTLGRHGNIKIADDFSLRLSESGDSGELKQAEFFSMGTYNQIYFALRLSVMCLTVPEDKRVLFLDDLLMTYDDERGKRAIDLLLNLCADNKMQTIMFTCHGRDLEYIKQTDSSLIQIS